MIKKVIQRIIAKILNSSYFLQNPYLIKIGKSELKFSQNLVLGEGSIIHSEAKVNNMSGNKKNIIIGRNSHIRGNLQIFEQGGEIKIGNFCYVGEMSKIWSAGKIHIGDNVLISHNVNIHDNISHPISSLKRIDDFNRIIGYKHFDSKDFDLKSSSIVIKNKAWIGFNVIILKGVTIGEGAIIGAGSLVKSDIPDWCIAVGNPARVIKYLDENER